MIDARADVFGQVAAVYRLDEYREQLRPSLDGNRLIGMLDVPDERLDEVWSLMREDGFHGLLGRDADLVQQLAGLGLASSSRLMDNVDSFFEPIDTTFEEAFAALEPFGDRFGMFRLVRGGEPFQPAVFCSV